MASPMLSSLRSKVESKTQGSKPKSQKNSKARLSEDRLSRGQGQDCSRARTKDTTRKCSPTKKGVCSKIVNFSRNFKRSPKKNKGLRGENLKLQTKKKRS